ncbi:MAG: DUF2842 domain-containing protein [Kordiimonadaceae bacterium]|nr:DUF2842 domain-containing protein [Kordiimonadaceae bacterium]
MSEKSSPKFSKLLWLLLMIAAMTIYILVISRLINAFFSGHIILELIGYLIAGIIWIFPAKSIMYKINRTNAPGKE